MTTSELIKQGYCRVSNAYGAVSRIDRSDWKEHMASKHPDGMRWVEILGEASAEDQYRRCYSKDRLELGKGRARSFPPSSGTITGYKPAAERKE